MLNWNGRGAKALYWGDKAVERAYLGEKLVFENKPTYTVSVSVDPAGSGTVTGAGQYQEGAHVTVSATAADGYQFGQWVENGSSGLPEGYQEVEYISNPNLGYIYPVMPNKDPFNDQRIEITVDLSGSEDGGIFGSLYYYWYNTARRCSNNRLYYGNNLIQLCLGYDSNSVYTKYYHELQAPSGIAKIIVDLPKSLFKVNDNSIETKVSNNDTNYTYAPALFGNYVSYTHRASASSTQTQYQEPRYPTNFKLYGFKVYQSTATDIGDLIMDLVPCISPQGTVGVYDLVSNTFTGNYDSKVLTAGAAAGGVFSGRYSSIVLDSSL